MKIDLTNRGGLERRIVGMLRNCIKEHGPITEQWAPSAAKRVIGAIRDFNNTQEKRDEARDAG